MNNYQLSDESRSLKEYSDSSLDYKAEYLEIKMAKLIIKPIYIQK